MVVYAPRLLAAASVRFSNTKLGVEQTREVILSASISDGVSAVNWSEAEVVEVDLSALEKTPVAGAEFTEVPAAASQAKNYAGWQKEFLQSLAVNQTLQIFRCVDLKAASKPDETEAEFKVRIALAIRENRDAAVEALRKKYAPKVAALQARLVRAEVATQKEKEQASNARLQTFISVGSTLLGAFLGRKALSSSTLGKAATAARGVGRSMKESSDVATAQQSAEQIRQQIADIETEIAAESAALAATEPPIESVKVKPLRSGITVRLLALAWEP